MNVIEAFLFVSMTEAPVIINIVTEMTPCCRDEKEMHILMPCNAPIIKC